MAGDNSKIQKFLMKKFLRKNRKVLVMTTLVFFAGIFLVVEPAHAKGIISEATDWIFGKIGDGAIALIEGAIDLVRAFSAYLLATAASFLNFMVSPKVIDAVFFTPEARAGITAGWTFVRDFINLFYIIALVFIAISIILGIDRYSDKKIIFTIILSALLVNFSMPITLFVIDVSNMAMIFFAENISRGGADYTALLANQINLGDFMKTYGNADGGIAFLVVALAEIVFTFVLAIMLFFLAVALVIRMIAFWILIILSPLAFFGFALPNFKGMTDDWFKKLTHYAFFGPVMLFFLWLALTVIRAINESMAKLDKSALQTEISSLESVATVSLSVVIPYVAAIYMLFYGYDKSKKMASTDG